MRSPLRVALRAEGDWWVAYVAEAGTMEGKVEIALTLLAPCDDPEIKQAFIDYAKLVFSKALARLDIPILAWDEEKAPESERSGSA